jgi:predicted nucleotidyltransferase
MKTLDHVCLKENDRQAVVAAATILRREFPVDNVVLFGSKARGDDQPESDVDLLVLTRVPVTPALKRQITHALFDIQLSYNVVLSMMIIPLEQWETGVYRILPIRQEIERDGVAA